MGCERRRDVGVSELLQYSMHSASALWRLWARRARGIRPAEVVLHSSLWPTRHSLEYGFRGVTQIDESHLTVEVSVFIYLPVLMGPRGRALALSTVHRAPGVRAGCPPSSISCHLVVRDS